MLVGQERGCVRGCLNQSKKAAPWTCSQRQRKVWSAMNWPMPVLKWVELELFRVGKMRSMIFRIREDEMRRGCYWQNGRGREKVCTVCGKRWFSSW